jgi:hypothetical protein
MATSPDPEPVADGLGADREHVLRHLARRFPEIDTETIERAVDEAAAATSDAKIQVYRALLVEHRAGNHLMRLRPDTAPRA